MSDYVPQDNLDQILKLLPVESLLRFRCVCKRWKEIIDSPVFIQDHLALQKPLFITRCQESEFVVVDPHNIPLVRTIRRPIERQPLMLLGTLHGVICLHDLGRDLWLWNPSIRKLLRLPPFSSDFDSVFYDQWKYCYGFWIDPSNKDFKIIILVFDLDEDDEPKDVNGILYLSTRHDWSVIAPAKLWRDWFSCHEDPPVIIGSVAHWGGGCDYKKIIMSFDFRQESFDFIEMPDLNYFQSPKIEPIPCKWQDTLSLLCCHPSFPYRCDMYLRQQGSWVNMFNFNFIPPACNYFSVILLGEMEKRFWVLGQAQWESQGVDHSDLLLYDTRVGSIHLKDNFRYWYVAYDFVESLLFP